MSIVYVLSPERRPLMPCSAAIARLLLKEKKAKVVRRTPFTIKLMAPPETTYTQPITLGVDTGSSVVGAAAADEKQKGVKKGTLRHATQMNSIRVQLLRRVDGAMETWGFVTKEHRLLFGLPKAHGFDASRWAKGRVEAHSQVQQNEESKCAISMDDESKNHAKFLFASQETIRHYIESRAEARHSSTSLKTS